MRPDSTGDQFLAGPPPVARRRGVQRVWQALRFSAAGLRVGWREPAFRQEACLAVLLVPASFWVGRSWLESSVLAGVVVHVLVVELLNTAVERTVDRIGTQWHPLSKVAKDAASAAVFLSILLAIGTWTAALVARLG